MIHIVKCLLNIQYFRSENQLRKWKIIKLTGLPYDPTIDYKNYNGTMNQNCKLCNALKWKGEKPGMCSNISRT